MTWYMAQSIKGEFLRCFEKLGAVQPPPYRIYKTYRGLKPDRAFKALVYMRRLQQPAVLRDWEDLVA
jgi:hypothetical protein